MGTYLQTYVSDNAYEEFQEEVFGNTSALVHVWRFDGVPAGTDTGCTSKGTGRTTRRATTSSWATS